jgi:phage shock protein A
MSDLFKKLNTLVQASINDMLGDGWNPSDPNRRRLSPERLGKDIDREVSALRQRINQALEHETHLQNQIQSASNEIARWDREADDAVVQNNDATARYAVMQMQQAERRRTMLESDLHEHRLVTQELIQRVNTLEAAIADARRAAQERAQATSGEAPSQEVKIDASVPATDKAAGALERATQAVSDVLRETREKITQMGEVIASREEMQSPAPASAPQTPAQDQKSVDDDLRSRLDRLSKK